MNHPKKELPCLGCDPSPIKKLHDRLSKYFSSVTLAKTVKRDEGRLKLQNRGPFNLHLRNPMSGHGKITSAALIGPRIQCERDLAQSSLKLF
jgi:hypothetical protein